MWWKKAPPKAKKKGDNGDFIFFGVGNDEEMSCVLDKKKTIFWQTKKMCIHEGKKAFIVSFERNEPVRAEVLLEGGKKEMVLLKDITPSEEEPPNELIEKQMKEKEANALSSEKKVQLLEEKTKEKKSKQEVGKKEANKTKEKKTEEKKGVKENKEMEESCQTISTRRSSRMPKPINSQTKQQTPNISQQQKKQAKQTKRKESSPNGTEATNKNKESNKQKSRVKITETSIKGNKQKNDNEKKRKTKSANVENPEELKTKKRKLEVNEEKDQMNKEEDQINREEDQMNREKDQMNEKKVEEKKKQEASKAKKGAKRMNKEESEQEQEEKEYQSGGKRKSRVQVGKADGTSNREIRVTSNNESPQYAPSNTLNPNNSTNLGLETSSKFFLQKNPQVYSHFNFQFDDNSPHTHSQLQMTPIKSNTPPNSNATQKNNFFLPQTSHSTNEEPMEALPSSLSYADSLNPFLAHSNIQSQNMFHSFNQPNFNPFLSNRLQNQAPISPNFLHQRRFWNEEGASENNLENGLQPNISQTPFIQMEAKYNRLMKELWDTREELVEIVKFVQTRIRRIDNFFSNF